MGTGAETRSPPWMQVEPRFDWRTRIRADRGSSAFVRTKTQSRQRQRRRHNDKGDTFGCATSKWIIVKFEWTNSSGKLLVSGCNGDKSCCRTSSSTSAYAVSAKQDCGVAVSAECVRMQPQSVEKAGIGPEVEGYSMDLLSSSTRRSTMNELDEDQ